MQLKTVEVEGETYAVIQDGKPVYVEEDGKETPFDAVHTRETISRLNGEAKSHRERAETAEKQLKGFEGIEDPDAARKAMQTVQNLDQKKLVDAGEVEKVKEEAIKAVKAEYEPFREKAETLEQELRNEKIGGSFARSKYIGDKLSIPPDLAQARFGNQFKLEEGGVVAYDQHGNKVYSRSRPGEVADFDEAMEIIVDQYPYKDNILKSSGASGGGAAPSAGGGGKNQVTRSQFDSMSPGERMEFSKGGGKVVDGD